MSNVCSRENCYNSTVARGLCNKHYLQIKKDSKFISRGRRELAPELIKYEDNTYGIILTQGYIAIIDKEDKENISKYIYHYSTVGYAARREGNKIIYLHQDIKGPCPEGFEIDHDDRNKLNNKRKNLIFRTHIENLRNTKRHQERLGIGFDSTHCKWKAYIDNPGQKRINIGTFSTKEEASLAVSTWRENNL